MGLFNFKKATKEINPMETRPPEAVYDSLYGRSNGSSLTNIKKTVSGLSGVYKGLESDANYWKIYGIYHETNNFYKTHLATGLLENINEELVGIVIDSASKITVNGEPVDSLEYKGLETNINLDLIREVLMMHNIYGACGILLTIGDNKLNFSVIEPTFYQYNEKKTRVYVTSIKDAVLDIGYGVSEENFKIPVVDNELDLDNKKLVPGKTIFIESKGERVLTDGILELSLFQSEILTQYQHEIDITSGVRFVGKGLVGDEELMANKSNYVVIDSNQGALGDVDISGLSDTSNTKPYLEVSVPQIRTSNYNEAADYINGLIANRLKIDQQTLSSTSTASAGISVEAKSVKKFNSDKRKVTKAINSLFLNLFGKNDIIELVLENTKLESEEAVIKNQILLISNKAGTSRALVEKLNPHMTKEELEIEYLKVEIKGERVLTLDESTRAIELGLLEEVPAEPDPVVNEALDEDLSTDDSFDVGEGAVDNIDKPNMQGVSTSVEPGSSQK